MRKPLMFALLAATALSAPAMAAHAAAITEKSVTATVQNTAPATPAAAEKKIEIKRETVKSVPGVKSGEEKALAPTTPDALIEKKGAEEVKTEGKAITAVKKEETVTKDGMTIEVKKEEKKEEVKKDVIPPSVPAVR